MPGDLQPPARGEEAHRPRLPRPGRVQQVAPHHPPLSENPQILQAVHPGAAAAAWPLLPAGEPGVRVLHQQPGEVGCLQCPLCSDTMVTRYLSPLEQQMVTQVVLGLSNVTYLSIQAVASNELGRREADMEAVFQNE